MANPDTLQGLIKTVSNRNNILAKVQVQLLGDDAEQVVEDYAALRGERPNWINGQLVYAHYDSHRKTSVVVYSGEVNSSE